jgi:hypothetical protein
MSEHSSHRDPHDEARFIVAIVFVGLATNACAAAGARHARASADSPTRDAPDRRAERASQRSRGGQETSGTPVAVAADSRGVIVSMSRAGVAALDRRGGVVWTIDLDGVFGGVPVLVGDRVVLPIARADGYGWLSRPRPAVGRDPLEVRSADRRVAVARRALVICVLRNGQSAGIPPNDRFPAWEFTFHAGVDSSTIEVPAGTAVAVDESTGSLRVRGADRRTLAADHA